MFIDRSINSLVGIDRFLVFQGEPASRNLQVTVRAGCGVDRILDAGAFKSAQINWRSRDDGGGDQRSDEGADEESRLT